MMNGRLENELSIYRKVETKLVEMPEYVIDWYYYLKANNQSAMTCRDYIRKVNAFLEWIKDNSINKTNYLSSINSNLVTRYFVSIQTKTSIINGTDVETETSDSYRQCVWSCLNNFFNYLVMNHYIKENYLVAAGIDRPSNHDLDRIKANRKQVTKSDFKEILDTMDSTKFCYDEFINRNKAMMLLLMTTGMRESALQSINIGDIDLDNHTIQVIDKGKKRHIYYLDNKVVDVLTLWMYDRNRMRSKTNSDAAFLSKEYKRISVNGIVKVVKKYSKAALGYEMSPHKFRSGLASILYDQKGDAEFVRRVIGHSNITTTQRYIITNNKEREEAVNMITDIIA